MQPEPEPDELAQFRKEWKAEVEQKLGQARAGSSAIPSRPVEIYRQAVEFERTGNLDEALRLYRHAFRLDPNVYIAYNREENMAAIASQPQPPTSSSKGKAPATESSKGASTDELNAALNALFLQRRDRMPNVTTMALLQIILNFPFDELTFAPEDEERPIPIQKLPDEVLVLIFLQLDHKGIERLASVNRKTRIVSLDLIIWKNLVESIYRPPQLPSISELDSLITNFSGDYRRLYIEQPRVRTDGVFISICQYVRAGISDNSWVNINHLVTYHRYLRFYPNGQVLSLLTNEELNPPQIIPILKPTLRMKGFYIGTWELIDSHIHISNLLDASGRFGHSLPTFSTASFHPSDPKYPVSERELIPLESTNAVEVTPGPTTKYVFSMDLHLRSRPTPGRFNKLELDEYASVDVATGEKVPLPLKHQKPFWFSRVRSYA